MCDRTAEFKRHTDLLTSIKSYNLKTSESTLKFEPPSNRSEFNEAASEIAKGVHRTSQILQKLTKLVKNQGLFDDPTEEINNLVNRIKLDISDLNSKCDSAQSYVDTRKRSLGDNNQLAIHGVNVVSSLKSNLMNATKGFKDVLELRSSKMKGQQQRKTLLTGSSTLSPIKQLSAKSDNNQLRPFNNNIITPYSQQKLFSDNDDSYSNGNISDQQLLLAPPVDAKYFESREKAVTEVEKTINELGQLFQRLGTMISQQQELVERIDEDIESAISNTEKAQSVLQRMYDSASSNRNMYVKLFFIIAIFVLFFILFLM